MAFPLGQAGPLLPPALRRASLSLQVPREAGLPWNAARPAPAPAGHLRLFTLQLPGRLASCSFFGLRFTRRQRLQETPLEPSGALLPLPGSFRSRGPPSKGQLRRPPLPCSLRPPRCGPREPGRFQNSPHVPFSQIPQSCTGFCPNIRNGFSCILSSFRAV